MRVKVRQKGSTQPYSLHKVLTNKVFVQDNSKVEWSISCLVNIKFLNRPRIWNFCFTNCAIFWLINQTFQARSSYFRLCYWGCCFVLAPSPQPPAPALARHTFVSITRSLKCSFLYLQSQNSKSDGDCMAIQLRPLSTVHKFHQENCRSLFYFFVNHFLWFWAMCGQPAQFFPPGCAWCVLQCIMHCDIRRPSLKKKVSVNSFTKSKENQWNGFLSH